jgi:hypothetical protein
VPSSCSKILAFGEAAERRLELCRGGLVRARSARLIDSNPKLNAYPGNLPKDGGGQHPAIQGSGWRSAWNGLLLEMQLN